MVSADEGPWTDTTNSLSGYAAARVISPELTTLLRRLGFRQVRTGSTGGSRRRFVHPEGCVISLHEPHPGRILKHYQIDQIIETLEREDLI
jgi:predicted RNA binding protein YcfA (HicA-like mRNA interferase family)